MKNGDRKSQQTSRRDFAKSLLPAFLAFQLAEAPSAEAQQKKRKRARKRMRQTSPITVGGGGGGRPGVTSVPYISIHFDHNWYTKTNPRRPKQYWNPADRLEKLWITDENGAKQDYPVTRRSVIVINCVRASDQHNSPLKVTARPLGIEFEESDYPYNANTQVHSNTERRITTIYIDGQLKFTAVDGNCGLDIDDP
jgi:hypothetical protein